MRSENAILATVLLSMLALPGMAQAATCSVDDTPATSLLIPYFEVDLSDSASSAPTTRFWIRNTATRPRLAQINLWTDWGIAAFAFYVDLPAKATQRIDLADVLIDGKPPSTGAGVSPIGDFDSLGTALSFPNCNNTSDPANSLPVTPNLSPAALANLRARLSGQPSPGDGFCWALDHGDGWARGYVTIDNVLECSNAPPPRSGLPGVRAQSGKRPGGRIRVARSTQQLRPGRARRRDRKQQCVRVRSRRCHSPEPLSRWHHT